MSVEAASPEDIRSALEQIAEYGTAPRGRARLIDVGTDPYLDYFEREILTALLAHGGATCKVIAGSYGSGKTHLLDLLQDVSAARDVVVVRTDLSQALDLTDWRSITRHVLETMELAIGGETYRSLPQLLDALGTAGHRMSYTGRGRLPHAGFSRAMALMLERRFTTGGRELLTRFLCGDSVTVRELDSYGIRGVKNSLSARNAESVLRTVVGGLSLCGRKGVLLLFDENERTFVHRRGSPSRRVLIGANLLRRLIDGTAGGQVPGLAAVMTVLPTFVDTCAEAYPALGQRLQLTTAEGKPSWRWPYLPITSISPKLTPEEFVSRISERFTQLAQKFGPPRPKLQESLRRQGLDVLTRHAGMDHRRYVSKALALSTLQIGSA